MFAEYVRDSTANLIPHRLRRFVSLFVTCLRASWLLTVQDRPTLPRQARAAAGQRRHPFNRRLGHTGQVTDLGGGLKAQRAGHLGRGQGTAGAPTHHQLDVVGAALGQQAFDAILERYPDGTQGERIVFVVGSVFSLLGALVTLALPARSRNLQDEDLAFRDYLARHGYDMSIFGEIAPAAAEKEAQAEKILKGEP